VIRIRAIIADDEALLREHLKRLLNRLWPELEMCGEAEHGRAALEMIQLRQPDIAFLDIRMPGLSGMDVAAQCDAACRIVFITAYDHYAVQAFEHHAIDYLLKPITEARLRDTVLRLKQSPAYHAPDLTALLRQLSTGLSGHTKPPLQWLRVQDGDGVALIHVDDVACFRAEHKYTIVRTRHGEKIIRMSLKALEGQLDRETFWRIHRGAIVNVRWIERIDRHFGGKLTLRLKHVPEGLVVSRSFAHLFRQM